MKFTKENVENAINDYFRQADLEPCGDLIAEIHNLDDTLKKVVVPKFVADWYEENLSGGYTHNRNKFSGNDVFRVIQDVLKVSEGLNTWEDYGIDEEITTWVENNEEDFIHLIVNCSYKTGYEVEKEPLYYVNINGQYLVKMIPERNVHKFVEEVNLRIWDPQAYQLTEAEIKAIDERYIPFMVPVDEVNND